MLDAKWEAFVKLAMVLEPRLGEKLLPLRALKETRYNITVGSHDKGARDAATHVIGGYAEAINKLTSTVWGESRGIRVEEAPAPAATEASGPSLPPPPAASLAAAPSQVRTAPVAASASPSTQAGGFAEQGAAAALAPQAAPVQAPAPAAAIVPPVAPPPPVPAPPAAAPPDAMLAGLLEEMRKKLRAEIQAEVQTGSEQQVQALRQQVESEVAAHILETNKKAEIQDTMTMIFAGKQLVQEVWQIWANLETLLSQTKDEELMKHIFVAEEKLHALIMLASRLLPVAVVEDRVQKSTHKK